MNGIPRAYLNAFFVVSGQLQSNKTLKHAKRVTAQQTEEEKRGIWPMTLEPNDEKNDDS